MEATLRQTATGSPVDIRLAGLRHSAKAALRVIVAFVAESASGRELDRLFTTAGAPEQMVGLSFRAQERLMT